MSDTQTTTIREAVGVFHNADEMEAAIEELEESGFDRAEISLLASQDAVHEKLGHAYADAKSLEDSTLRRERHLSRLNPLAMPKAQCLED